MNHLRTEIDPEVTSVMQEPMTKKALEAMDMYDHYTFWHMVSVASESAELARELVFLEEKRKQIITAALLHDIGKIQIPLNILNKPERLTEEEFQIMKSHSVLSEQYIRNCGCYSEDVIAAARWHHENYNGSGYPDGLRGHEINEFARIIRITDSYDAILDKRVYKDRQSSIVAFRELCKGCEEMYDPEMLEAFFRLADKKKL